MIGTINMPWIGAVVRPRAVVGATNAARGGALPAAAVTGIAFAAGGTASAGEAAGALRLAPRAPWVDDRKPGL